MGWVSRRFYLRTEKYVTQVLFNKLINVNGRLVPARRIPHVLGYGAVLAVLLGAFDYGGGVLSGYSQDPDVDEYERKQKLRKNWRRPIQETIDELGEGRGEIFVTLPTAGIGSFF
jgi:hypothetical protein